MNPVEGVCRDCNDGKHNACSGEALVITAADDVVITDCRCADNDHQRPTV